MEPRASVNRNHVASEPNGDHGTDSASSLASFTWVFIKDDPSIFLTHKLWVKSIFWVRNSDIGHFKMERKTRYEYDSLFSSHGGQAEILFGLNYSPLTGKLPHKYYTGTKHYLRTIIGWTVEGITLQKSHNTKGTWYFCNIDFTWWQLQGKMISPQSHPDLTPTTNLVRISP